MKFVKDGIVVIEDNENHFNVWEREGFTRVEEDDDEPEVKKTRRTKE